MLMKITWLNSKSTQPQEIQMNDKRHEDNKDEGTGIGAVVGGAAGGVAGGAAAGAAMGGMTGPVGAVVGAAAGAVVGALGGRKVADEADDNKTIERPAPNGSNTLDR
jgi:outer membrane lipoprotein SlyB